MLVTNGATKVWSVTRVACPTASVVPGLALSLEEFVTDHRPHGALTGDVTEPDGNGYLIMVVCPCGVTFERWVTPKDASRSPA
jgi:hypothetical protein